MNERVSVIIPVYNGERFLRPAVEGVLCQTRPVHEIIVVDDGSTDGSAALAQSLPVVYLHQANQGPSAARNLAVSRAEGDFLAFLDQDDVWLPHKTETQLAALHENPSAAYALCHLRFLFDPEVQPPSWFHRKGPEEGEPGFAPSCWLIPRSTWDKVGCFQSDKRYTQDMDWLARANDLSLPATMVAETLVLKRIHSANLLGDVDAAKKEMLRTLMESASRKKGLGKRG